MRRVVIKLSGEGLSSRDENLAIDPKIIGGLVKQINEIQKDGIQVAIVVGGGNF